MHRGRFYGYGYPSHKDQKILPPGGMFFKRYLKKFPKKFSSQINKRKVYYIPVNTFSGIKDKNNILL